MEQISCTLTAGEVEFHLYPASTSFCQPRQSLWHGVTSLYLWVDKQNSLQTSSYTSCRWLNSGECLCLKEQQCGANLKVGLFPHRSLSFAMNPVFTYAIAAAHTLWLSLSCTLWISTVATQEAAEDLPVKTQTQKDTCGLLSQARKITLRRNLLCLVQNADGCPLEQGTALAVLLLSENTLITNKAPCKHWDTILTMTRQAQGLKSRQGLISQDRLLGLHKAGGNTAPRIKTWSCWIYNNQQD